MKDRIFFDTNVLVYLFDKSDMVKHEKSIHIIKGVNEKLNYIISSQVVNEFINIITKKIENRITMKKAKQSIEILDMIFQIAPLSFSTSKNAIDIQIKYKISFWDSLILASALENNCQLLYSEDMHESLKIDKKLQVINPYS